MRGIARQRIDRHREHAQRLGHRTGQEILAPIHRHPPRQTARPAGGIIHRDRRMRRRQHRLPRRRPRRHRSTTHRVRRDVDGPRSPRLQPTTHDINLDRRLHTVALPHRSAVRRRTLQEHIEVPTALRNPHAGGSRLTGAFPPLRQRWSAGGAGGGFVTVACAAGGFEIGAGDIGGVVSFGGSGVVTRSDGPGATGVTAGDIPTTPG